ncbi:MAG: type II toxin-antitoxin system HicB family antitoxin [Thermodesulfobacteriota bacterium]|nr:type II toxin-antitoxin system HicB family antitoxin [Thermodesulfobacteriota bacterium]
MSSTVTMNFHLPIKIEKKEKWFVASCPLLDVFSQGETLEQAEENLKEALTVFFISCINHGNLDAVLKECGFKSIEIPPISKESIASEEKYIDVPLELLSDLKGCDYCLA